MKLEVLVGMIGSGKSTYARKRADEGALVVCHDDLTQMLHARYRYEQGLRDLYRRMEESLARDALFAGKDVVIDRTHLTRESRHRWLSFIRNHELGLDNSVKVPVVAVSFPIHEAYIHAARRVGSDARGRTLDEWIRVAQHHAEQAAKEPLSEAEGFDEIIRIEGD